MSLSPLPGRKAFFPLPIHFFNFFHKLIWSNFSTREAAFYMKATSACGTFYLLVDVVILATAISKHHHSVLCFIAAWNLLPPSLCLQAVLQKQIALSIPRNFPSNPTALRNNWNIIQIFKTTHDKLGKNPLISMRSSLDFTLGELSLGNSISTDCVFPSHLLHVSKGKNRIIVKLFYLTNINKNLVKKYWW